MQESLTQINEIPHPPNLGKQQQSVKFVTEPNIMTSTLQQHPPYKRNFNLKIGDIIYFKSYPSDDFKGVVSGDGIASNKLECVQLLDKEMKMNYQIMKPKTTSNTTLQCKAASLAFNKCLFQVVNGKKYYYQNQLEETEKNLLIPSHQLMEYKRKAQEEIEENKRLYTHLHGSNLVYGQEIQLIHLYSQCILTLNHQVLARQNCCRELSLEENANQYSNFRLMSINNAKSTGEPVLYGDQLIIKNSVLYQWALGIQKFHIYDFQSNSLEVNASEQPASLKVSSYIDHKTEQELEQQQIKGKFIQSGDVITIKSRYLSGFLAIKRLQNITDKLDERSVYFKDYETNTYKEMKQQYFDVEALKENSILEEQYQLYVDVSDESANNLNILWQIQHKDSLNYFKATYDSVFLIKHVSTGLFLQVDPTSNRLTFTYDGLNPECMFQLKSKKNQSSSIAYQEALKIQSQLEPNLIIQCGDVENVKMQKKSQKKYLEQSIFLMNLADDEVTKTAHRINSLQTYLLQFYLFLQNWGIDDNKGQLFYEYYTAFNNQKSLSDSIQQLFQSLENLKFYLTNDGKPQSTEQLALKQQSLLDNDLLNLLFAIQYICNFMIFGEQKRNDQQLLIPEKSPQKISKIKLDPNEKQNCIKDIYNIIQLIIQSNTLVCDQVLKMKIKKIEILDFLLSQLRFQRQHISELLKETVRFSDMSNPEGNIKKWIKQIQMVSEQNIEDQSLYVELLSLIMIDPYETPNQFCQDICRKFLQKKFKNDEVSAFDRGGLQFKIQNDNGTNYPFVNFLCGKNKESGANFALNNPIFCKLYSKYVEKLSRVEGRFHQVKPKINEIVVDFFTTATIKKFKLIRQEDLKTDLPIFQKYETYVLHVLNLYGALCKGRNAKSIKFLIKDCGVTPDFIKDCLKHFQLDTNKLRFERTLINLYSSLLLDTDPLTQISKFQNKTYLKDDLQKFDLSTYSGGFFYESDASRQLKDSKEYSEYLRQTLMKRVDQQQTGEHQQLKLYALKLIDQTNNKEGLLSFYVQLFCSHEYPKHLQIEEIEKEPHMKKVCYKYPLFAQFQLEYFLSLLKLIKNSIDLGYNELDTNRRIFQVLPNIFLAIAITEQYKENPVYLFDENKSFSANMTILTQQLETIDYLKGFKQERQDIEEFSDFQKLESYSFFRNWILEFLIWTTVLCQDKLLCIKIYLESLAILNVFYALKINLQILSFIGDKHGNQSVQEISQPKSLDSNSMHSQGSSPRSIGQNQIIDILQENKGVNMTSILFNCLFSSEKRTVLNEELIKILIQSFNLPKICIQEIKEVELIDDQKELQFYSIVNGNSATIEWMSPKEAMIEAKRSLKLISSKFQKNRKTDYKPSKNVLQAFDNMITYLNQILEQFEKIQKENPTYIGAFQNILRNAGVHFVFQTYLIQPKYIQSNEKIVLYYKNIIRFFELFIDNNMTNITEIATQEWLSSLLNIVQLKQEQAQLEFYIPLKITKLIISIMSAIEIDQEDFITKIFELITKLGKDLTQSLQFFSEVQYEEQETLQSDRYIPELQQRELYKQIIDMASIIQYLKILKQLTKTFDKPSKSIPSNKHLILTSILKNEFLRFLLEPINFFANILLPESKERIQDDKILTYYQMLLHANTISLISSCCQYYRLGIQEMQRILLYEQLKSILLSQQSSYIVKQAYLQCLFELYINMVYEGDQVNEVVDNDEVRDILSRVIIPELDEQQICKYLEGLARLNSSQRDFKKESIDLRNQIKRQKIEYFEKRQNQQQQQSQGQIILRDLSEFWKYIRKNGVLHFLVYTYDEMKDRVDLDRGEESNLSDEFAIIKQNVQQIKDIFNVLERDFRMKKEDLDLDEYRDLITSIEEIIPQRKITRFGKNFRIDFQQSQLRIDKYDTQKEDQNGEKKLQEQDNVQRIENQFQRNFKIYLIRNFTQIQELTKYIDSFGLNEDQKYVKIKETCNIYKEYIRDQDITDIKTINVEKIKQKEKVNNPAQTFNNWEVFKQALYELFQRKKINSFEQFSIKESEEQKLSALKRSFEESVKSSVFEQLQAVYGTNIKRKEYSDLLNRDIQIQILLKYIEQTRNLSDKHQLSEFLRKCEEIFLGKEVYLIKLCRIFLQSKQPTEDEIDLLSEVGEVGQDDYDYAKRKLALFRELQITISSGGIDKIALTILSNQYESEEMHVEAITLLVSLLEYGNEEVQRRLILLFKEDQNMKNSFITFLREFFLIDINVKLYEVKLSEQETIYEQLCMKVLKLLQGLCENVNIEFQRFLVIQNEDDSYRSNMNIVSEVANLLANILEDTQVEFNRKNSIIRQAMESLIEFSTGYPDNKVELCKNTRLFTLLNQKIAFNCEKVQQSQPQNFNNQPDSIFDDESLRQAELAYNNYRTLESFIKLLLALTQGQADLKSLKFVQEMIDISTLITIAKKIYDQRIQPKIQNIILDNICDENTGVHKMCCNYYCIEQLRSDEDNLLIQTGFNIFIICIKLYDQFPTNPDLEIFKFDEDKDEEFEDDERAFQKLPSNQWQISRKSQILPMAKYEYDQVPQVDIQFGDIKKLVDQINQDPNFQFQRKEKFFKFYREFTGRIEIKNKDNGIEKIYFQKPFLSKYMTPNIKHHIIFQSKRETDEDRMLSLIENSDFYQLQLIHSQKINNRPLLQFGATYWRIVKDLSFALCVVIVIFLIFMHDTIINSKLGSNGTAPEDTNVTAGEVFVSWLNNIITIIQLILNLVIIFFCAFERYPISITYRKGETNAKKVQILKKEAGFSISSLTMLYYSIIGSLEKSFEEDQVKRSLLKKAILVTILDWDNFYNIIIFGLTAYAFFNPYIYAVILLDIVKRSEDLQNIIRSITLNGKNLAIFSFLGLIALLCYAIIAFNQFRDDFDGVYANEFILAVTTVINFGLRNGGGIGESMNPYPDPQEFQDLYWGRWFFDFTFFIIFNILFIQIIFGIILDTFGELRDERQALIQEIEGKCFVCSMSRNDIDTKGAKGWYHHIYLEHNVYHMLYYIIYLKSKNLNDCNALEKFVKEQITQRSTEFFPFNRALQIEDDDLIQETIE